MDILPKSLESLEFLYNVFMIFVSFFYMTSQNVLGPVWTFPDPHSEVDIGSTSIYLFQ